MNDIIEGEIGDEPGKKIATADANAGTVAVFNPLDAEPVAFKRQLEIRQQNYDNLREHLFGELVPGKDFGKIHIVKKCDNKYSCTNAHHFSGYTLFSPGADKILGILGLSVYYPDLQDYKRAALKGLPINEVITDAQILGHNEQVIASGVGACARSEIANGNLNNTIKRACKRARVDAVKRLPTISALFQDDILEELAAAAKRNQNNAARKRTQTVKNPWDTGAILEVCPIGNEIRGKAWREIDTGALEWLVANVTDKPDVTRAATGELSKRVSATDPGSIRSSSPPALEDE